MGRRSLAKCASNGSLSVQSMENVARIYVDCYPIKPHANTCRLHRLASSSCGVQDGGGALRRIGNLANNM
jgi:hypothetical protein